MDPVKLLTYGLEYFGLYYGTYKGQVVSTADPLSLGRVQVHCPTIHGNTFPQAWALPMASMAGKSFGFWHVPDVGEWVHVRFDHGRLEYPQWEGGWWGQGDTTTDMSATNIVICVKEGLKVVLNRQAKSILLQQDSGNSVLIDPSGITLNHQHDVKINAQGAADITAQTGVTVTAPKVTINAPVIDLEGSVTVDGSLNVTGAAAGLATISGNIAIHGTVVSTGEGTFNGITVSTHTHPGVQSGTSNTGLPQG